MSTHEMHKAREAAQSDTARARRSLTLRRNALLSFDNRSATERQRLLDRIAEAEQWLADALSREAG